MFNSISLTSIEAAFSLTLSSLMASLLNFLPRLIASLIVLFVGLLLGRWAKTLVKSILQAIKLDHFNQHSPLQKFFKRAEIQIKLEELIGETLRWLILYIFLIAAFNLIGLNTVSQFLTNILSYVPRVISASLIFTLGVIAAGFTESLIKSTLASLDLITARMVGKIGSYTVVIFASLVAVGELGIAKEFINILFIGFVAMFSLAFGLAFGLGAKDLVKEAVEKWYRQLHSSKSRHP